MNGQMATYMNCEAFEAGGLTPCYEVLLVNLLPLGPSIIQCHTSLVLVCLVAPRSLPLFRSGDWGQVVC